MKLPMNLGELIDSLLASVPYFRQALRAILSHPRCGTEPSLMLEHFLPKERGALLGSPLSEGIQCDEPHLGVDPLYL